MNKLKDTDLREALRRNYAHTPHLPEGFMEKMHEAMEQEDKQPRRARRYRLAAAITSIAAAILIAFILWPTKNIPISQPLSRERSAHLGERAEATTQQPALEATVAQPQPTISSKALAERKRKKAIPKPIPEPLQEEVPDEPQTNEETAHPIDLYEASYRPQIDEIMTVEELRARGNRLTENIRQQLQAINVTY